MEENNYTVDSKFYPFYLNTLYNVHVETYSRVLVLYKQHNT